MTTNKVTSEIATKLHPDVLPSYDGLPSYEYAIQMPADYIKIPSNNCDFIVNTTQNSHNTNEPYLFDNDYLAKNCHLRQKLLIVIFILSIFGLIILALLIC